MNKRYCLLIPFLIWRICVSQNLIQNSGFENYTGCTLSSYVFDSIQYWKNPTLGSPDYFKSCANLVPNNYAAFQYPHSGDAYAGLVIKNSGIGFLERHEYIQCPLAAPLVIGTKYILSMYVNLANYYIQYGSSSIAGLLTTYPYFQNDNLAIPLTPQARNDTSIYVTDTLGWQLIQMPFTADLNYSYVTIGNFLPDSLTTYVFVQNGTFPRAYFLLDDISLIVDPNSGISENASNRAINVFPNPFRDKLNIIEEENVQIEIKIYDILSRQVLQQKFTNSVSINTEQLPKGIYSYEVRDKNGVIKNGKVVKE